MNVNRKNGELWIGLAFMAYVFVLSGSCETRARANAYDGDSKLVSAISAMTRELAGIRRALEAQGRCK